MISEQEKLLSVLAALPKADAIITDSTGFSMSTQELTVHVDDLLSELNKVPQGTRIATLLPDKAMTALSLMAMVHHVKVIPINPNLSQVEISNILEAAQVQALLSAQDDKSARSIASLHNLPLGHLQHDGTLDLPRMNQSASSAGLVLLTSGSTGLPKRVPLTPDQLHLSAARIAKSLELTSKDRAVHALPMFHIGAIVDLLLAPLIAGGSVHFAGGMDARSLEHATMQHSGTWLQLVPTMLARLQAELSDVQAAAMGKNLRFIRSVSSDLAPQKHKMAEAFFAQTPIIQMYGMTETAGQITTNPLPPKPRKYGSVGRAIDVEVRCQNAEIQVKGPCVTKGYEGLGTKDQFSDDGWLRTGDLGYFDDDGYLFLTGRIKEMINRGGENISPHEIEHAALTYGPAIEAAAYARAHPSLGEEVGLAVSLAPEGSLEGLKIHLANSLAPFKVPRKPLILDPLPRLGSGKIDRRALRALTIETNQNADQKSRSTIGILVAQAWCTVLPETDEDELTDSSDFFDVGGDSLSGAQFLFEVERLTNRSLPTNLLYDFPEFGAFTTAVETAPIRQIADDADPKHVFLQDRLALWDAPHVDGVPFMRVLNQNAKAAPLFWCVQEEGEYQQLAKAFADKRPLYLMRSLFLKHGKDDDQNFLLAKDYAEAIAALQPSGDIALGGFCEGAKIMRFASEHLSAMKRMTKVLISWDQWFETAQDVPTLHFWSDERFEKYRQVHLFPERAIASAHPNGYKIVRVGGEHSEVLTQGPLEPFLQTLETALDHGILEKMVLPDPVFDSKISGHLETKIPHFFKRGSTMQFAISIYNNGDKPWNATAQQPVYLSAQIKNLDGFVASSLAGQSKIVETINPKSSVDFDISVTFPKHFQPVKLLFDLVDGASNSASKNGLTKSSKILFPNIF